MLKFGKIEVQVLDLLLRHKPWKVAEIMAKRGYKRFKGKKGVQKVYNVNSYFKRKVLNGEEFLAVSKSKYKRLLKRRVKTPNIMPDLDEKALEVGDKDFIWSP
jgi:hypothetical protein